MHKRDHITNCLTDIIDDATYLQTQLTEIELHAYTKTHTGDQTHIQTSNHQDLNNTGTPQAKTLWNRLTKDTHHVALILNGLRNHTERLWAQGKIDPKRGSLICSKDFKESLKAQHKRQQRGEFDPHKIEPQPTFPNKP